jgi:hypothetical protein
MTAVLIVLLTEIPAPRTAMKDAKMLSGSRIFISVGIDRRCQKLGEESTVLDMGLHLLWRSQSTLMLHLGLTPRETLINLVNGNEDWETFKQPDDVLLSYFLPSKTYLECFAVPG